MKGVAKYSEQFFTPIGTRKWIGFEFEFDMNTEDPISVYKRIESAVHQCAKSNSQVLIDNSISPGPSNQMPVINKEEERLEILIDNAKTIQELLGYKDSIKSPRLAEFFSKKLHSLNK